MRRTSIKGTYRVWSQFLVLRVLAGGISVHMICVCSWRRCRALLHSAHPAAASLFGERRGRQIIWSWRRRPAQFRCQLEFHSCFCFVDCAFFLVSIFMMKAARLASNICVFQSCRCSMRSFWDRKVCVFGFYLFVISIFFSCGDWVLCWGKFAAWFPICLLEQYIGFSILYDNLCFGSKFGENL